MSMIQQQLEAAERRPASRRERVLLGASVAVAALALTGLGLLLTGDEEASPSPPPAISAGAPSPSPSVERPPMAPVDLAAAEAQDRYRDFIRIDDEVARGGYADPSQYDLVAVDPERAQRTIEARQFQGARVSGQTQVVSLTVEAVTLPTNTSDLAEVRLLACLDVSRIEAVDADGKSLVAPGRLDRILSRVLLQRFELGDFSQAPTRQGWFVSEVDQRGEAC